MAATAFSEIFQWSFLKSTTERLHFLKPATIILMGLGHNIEQIFRAFLLNIRNYSPEVSNTQRRKAEFITLLRENNFDIKQKMAWNICSIIIPNTKQNHSE